MSTNSSSDDTDLSCVFLPGGPSDLIPGTEVTPAIKQAVTVPCGATSSTGVRTALRLTVEPVCLKWQAYFVFRLFLLLEAFVCCIWSALSLRWEEREDLFPSSVCVCVCRTVPIWTTGFSVEGDSFIHHWKTSATFSILAFLHHLHYQTQLLFFLLLLVLL